MIPMEKARTQTPTAAGTQLISHASNCSLVQTFKVSPVRNSLRILLVSMSGVRIPSMVPNMLPRPRLTSMRKNMTDQKGEAGKWVMASVKAMKAKPVPWTTWRGEGTQPD